MITILFTVIIVAIAAILYLLIDSKNEEDISLPYTNQEVNPKEIDRFPVSDEQITDEEKVFYKNRFKKRISNKK